MAGNYNRRPMEEARKPVHVERIRELLQ